IGVEKRVPEAHLSLRVALFGCLSEPDCRLSPIVHHIAEQFGELILRFYVTLLRSLSIPMGGAATIFWAFEVIALRSLELFASVAAASLLEQISSSHHSISRPRSRGGDC